MQRSRLMRHLGVFFGPHWSARKREASDAGFSMITLTCAGHASRQPKPSREKPALDFILQPCLSGCITQR